MLKKLLSMALVLMLVLASVPAVFAEEYPSYLNLESMLPVVKEGEEAPTLKVVIKRPMAGTEWEDLWLASYIEKYMGVNLEVEMVDSEALDTYKTTMFASGELPDILMNMDLKPADLMNYGQYNQQLLDLKPYINETLTPNMAQWAVEEPEAFAQATTPDGCMYTLPWLAKRENETGYISIKINTEWLEKLGAEKPATLDELLALLRKMKEEYPDTVPLGGAIDQSNPGYFILNAMGYVCYDLSSIDASYGILPATRNAEFELPCYSELFKEYLTIMKTMYDEGIITENFFLADKTEVDADVIGNNTVVSSAASFTLGIENWADWEALTPLTSQWNETPATTIPVVCDVGGFAVSAATEYPELCMKFADVFFSHDYTSRMMWVGPRDGNEEAMEWRGNIATGGGEGWEFPSDFYPEGVTNLVNYLYGYVSIYPNLGSNRLVKTMHDYSHVYLDGVEYNPQNYDLTDPHSFERASTWNNVAPYGTKYTYPRVVYFDEDTAQLEADLLSVIQPYVKQQVAMFINGDRSLDEFDAYREELRNMGVEDLIAIYEGAWDAYKTNLDQQ